ncbi:MAG: glycerate kinase [Treponema sp.]|nr:glycerate kinase [Candidatus Treponema caballi]
MKILLAPDSFKGSLSAADFCIAFEKGARKARSDLTFDCLPVADGGEGTLSCLLSAMDGKTCPCPVQNPLYEETEVPVGFFDNGRTAVIEAALANGLPLVVGRGNPELTSTYGVGQMIAFAVDMGAKKIILTLGGSSTNDCGLGMLAALGGCFYNADGVSFVPTGGTLKDIAEIDLSMMYPRLQGALFEGMCDVTNPLCGENGCSAIYGPQKGADAAMVERLDAGCRHVADLFMKMRTTDFSLEAGAGAAGGMGFAILAALNGKLRSGIDMVLDLTNFDKRLASCDRVVTGEGSFDYQSLMGKVIGGIVKRVSAAEKPVPVSVFCGKCGTLSEKPAGLADIVEISAGQKLDYAMTHAAENVENAAEKWAAAL